jgi:RHS repeat-associated protein
MTDEFKNLVDTYVYKAYGELLAETGGNYNPYRWVGRYGYQFDNQLSLNFNEYYIRQRHYGPLVAAWLSADPVAFADGLNRYLYAYANPIAFVDPSGLFVAGIGLGCAGGAAGNLLTSGIDYWFGRKGQCEFLADLTCDTLAGCMHGALGGLGGRLSLGGCLGAGALIGILDEICKSLLKNIFCDPCPVDWKCALANGLVNALGGAGDCVIGGDKMSDLLFLLIGLDVTIWQDISCKVAGAIPLGGR